MKKINKSINVKVSIFINVQFLWDPSMKKIKIWKIWKPILMNIWFFGKTPVYLKTIIFKPKYWDLFWAIKMESYILKKWTIQ